jgi:type IV pilus assembly protein PilY1
LWEFTDGNDPDLGYTFSQPSIIRVRDGGYRWVAVFGNGYNSTEADDNGACDDGSDTTPCTVSSSGHAVLYIVDIKTGAVVKKLDTGAGTSDNPNGLSTPAPVDVDGDYVADYVYAGDLQGNLWKFDLTSTDLTSTESPPTPNWTVAFDGNPLFTPTTLGAQPITSRPEIGPHPDGILAGVLVYFGTGQYMATGDNTITDDMPDQTFYAIWDKDDGTTRVTGRGDLQVQTITDEVDFLTGNACTGTAGEVCVRLTSDNAVDWSTKTGWYMDTYTNGERIVSNPFLRNKRIVFTTLIPDSDACEFGGTGWVMEMNAETGARLTYSPFDLNGDLEFTGDDKVTTGTGDSETHVVASGRKSTVGLIPKPTVLAGDDQEFKYASGSTGNVQTLVENPGPEARGRVTWRQLR